MTYATMARHYEYIIFLILNFGFQILPAENLESVSNTKEYFQYKFSLQRNLLEEKEKELSGNNIPLTEVSVAVFFAYIGISFH
jgi:hypothetical protein